ncbi:WapI family immunity protein [Oceanobacillus jeddahense]|uniref:WapI family immunity protein n=1 Tax=Oceanobacillus jeddahense TaxID=1462527 RepID=UPI003B84981C
MNSTIKVEIPGYYVDFNASLRTDDIRDFVNDLKLMNRHLTGKAILKNLDGFIHFECKMNQLGHIAWSGETCYPAGSGAILRFKISANQSYLDHLMKELEDIIYTFPVIGEQS